MEKPRRGIQSIEIGTRVRVTGVDGLTLTVERAASTPGGEPATAPAEAPAPL